MLRRSDTLYLLVGGLGMVAGCSGPNQASVTSDTAQVHLGADWFAYRADGLSISVDEARARDAALDEDAPPEGLWDAQLARESASLWLTRCALCHGADGDLEGAVQMDPPARKWGTFGTTMGFLFGGDKMRAGIYRTIRDGKGQMPGWGDRLAREQIWGLVAHIEGF